MLLLSHYLSLAHRSQNLCAHLLSTEALLRSAPTTALQHAPRPSTLGIIMPPRGTSPSAHPSTQLALRARGVATRASRARGQCSPLPTMAELCARLPPARRPRAAPPALAAITPPPPPSPPSPPPQVEHQDSRQPHQSPPDSALLRIAWAPPGEDAIGLVAHAAVVPQPDSPPRSPPSQTPTAAPSDGPTDSLEDDAIWDQTRSSPEAVSQERRLPQTAPATTAPAVSSADRDRPPPPTLVLSDPTDELLDEDDVVEMGEYVRSHSGPSLLQPYSSWREDLDAPEMFQVSCSEVIWSIFRDCACSCLGRLQVLMLMSFFCNAKASSPASKLHLPLQVGQGACATIAPDLPHSSLL